jgi:hypothetical protein
MQKALEAGVIRPFLLLVTMTPMERIRIAGMLGFCTVSQQYFGSWNDDYVHQEAWEILHCHLFGIQARTNATYETLNPFARNCNWYECLRRAISANFKVL